MFKKTFQGNLIIPVHEVARGNHKAIIKEGFCWYFNKVQKITSDYNCKLHQWLRRVFFALYYWNEVPVDGTDIYLSVVDIGI